MKTENRHICSKKKHTFSTLERNLSLNLYIRYQSANLDSYKLNLPVPDEQDYHRHQKPRGTKQFQATQVFISNII